MLKNKFSRVLALGAFSLLISDYFSLARARAEVAVCFTQPPNSVPVPCPTDSNGYIIQRPYTGTTVESAVINTSLGDTPVTVFAAASTTLPRVGLGCQSQSSQDLYVRSVGTVSQDAHSWYLPPFGNLNWSGPGTPQGAITLVGHFASQFFHCESAS